MKKILFITIRNPFSGKFSGDVIRSKKFIQFLSKKNYVDVISIDKNADEQIKKKIRYFAFKDINILYKFFNILFSILRLKPMQLGYFYSPKIKRFVEENSKKYDLFFFQTIRAAQYIPKNEIKKSVLDMGDLYSINYNQMYKKLFFLNPLKIIYLIESLLIKKYEDFCFDKFNKILLFSKNEINTVNKEFKKKLLQADFGIDEIKNKYKFNKKNYKIIFIGNIKYTPNRQACYQFINKTFPKIIVKYPEIEFHIIGEISILDKFILEKKSNVKVFGRVKNLIPFLNRTICGMANLDVSSGIQTKILTYMSYGIPTVCSYQVAKSFDAINKCKVNFYKNENDMLKLIYKFKENKKFSLSASNRSLKLISQFKWRKVLLILNKIF